MPKDLGISLTRRWRCSEKLSRSFQKKNLGRAFHCHPFVGVARGSQRWTRDVNPHRSYLTDGPIRNYSFELISTFFCRKKRTYQQLGNAIPSNPDCNAGAIALGKRRWDPRLAVTATGRAAPPSRGELSSHLMPPMFAAQEERHASRSGRLKPPRIRGRGFCERWTAPAGPPHHADFKSRC